MSVLMWGKSMLVSSLKVWNSCQARVSGKEARVQVQPQQDQTVPLFRRMRTAISLWEWRLCTLAQELEAVQSLKGECPCGEPNGKRTGLGSSSEVSEEWRLCWPISLESSWAIWMFAAGCSPTLNKIDYVAWITAVRVGVDQDDTGKE